MAAQPTIESVVGFNQLHNPDSQGMLHWRLAGEELQI
jgi:hypothetical protein